MLLRLRVFRVSRGLTQAQMADRLGYSESHYSRIEGGYNRPRPYFWESIKTTFRLTDEQIEKLKVDRRKRR